LRTNFYVIQLRIRIQLAGYTSHDSLSNTRRILLLVLCLVCECRSTSKRTVSLSLSISAYCGFLTFETTKLFKKLFLHSHTHSIYETILHTRSQQWNDKRKQLTNYKLNYKHNQLIQAQLSITFAQCLRIRTETKNGSNLWYTAT